MDISDVQPFLGKWKLVESQNFEEFLRANGAPKLLSEIQAKAKPPTEIKLDDTGAWLTFITNIKVKSIVQTARIDGIEHEVDTSSMIPFKKGKGVQKSKLTFEKSSGVMTIEITGSDGKEKKTAKRWIEKETDPESGSVKFRMTLELTRELFDHENEARAENEDREAVTQQFIKAVRIFEKE